jgi:sugar phosphate isomerase/epimerase
MDENPWGALEHMAALGYQGIEGSFALGETDDETRENARRLAGLGLETVCLSCSQDDEDHLDQAIANAHLLGTEYLVTYYGGPQTRDETLRLAQQLERIAQRCEAEGLTYLYHNHAHEFEIRLDKKGNETVFDTLVGNTEKLAFQLDTGWARIGGADPLTLIRRLGQRIPVLHLRDTFDDARPVTWCAIGIGKIPCLALIEAAAARGTAWMDVEIPQPGALSKYESAVASILNLRAAGLAP